MTTTDLDRLIDKINAKNSFDLAWEWTGSGPNPMILIFEREEGHELISGPLDTMDIALLESISAWGLEAPDDLV